MNLKNIRVPKDILGQFDGLQLTMEHNVNLDLINHPESIQSP